MNKPTTDDIYHQLAQHLDRLPGGFPPAPDGLEIRILQRLFTPAEAALARRLTLIPERASVIGLRAGLPADEALALLEQMSAKGLVLDQRKEGRPPRFMALQFVVGIWEFQVNRLTPELVQEVDEYLKTMFDPALWQKAPQLRTIPVGESLQAPAEVLLYESAERLLERHDRFAVTNCICRQERALAGEGCGKPLETCLAMGGAADFAIRHGRGRAISKAEAQQVLRLADQAGLVLQPGNTQEADYLCCCCGDCCGILRNAKRHPEPGRVISSAYYAVNDPAECLACGDCLERCQMEAISLETDHAVIDLRRCIGCGLCVTTCLNGALRLARKPEGELPYVPKNTVEMYLRLAQARGLLGPGELARIALKSGFDRLRAP